MVVPSGRRVTGRVQPPPSKSITQRVLNLSLLAQRPIEITRPLMAEDTEHFVAALEGLGFECDKGEGRLALSPGTLSSRARIWCGNNGTMLRFLTAALTTVSGEWILDGSERLRQRPIGPLVDALRALNARIAYLETEGFAPITIEGGLLQGGRVELDASLSSQFVSALLMAATQANGEVVLQVRDLVSAPYLRLTQEILKSFGAVAVEDAGSSVFRIEPTRLKGGSYEVEGDFSSAAYPAAAAVLTGGNVAVEGLRRDSSQGDREFLTVLERMGATVEWDDKGFRIHARRPLTAVDVDLSSMPDQVPTLAVIAPFAAGRTVIRNVRHLRLKESDRLAAMVGEMQRLGATIGEREDGLEIEGSWADRRRIPDNEVVVESHGDHRVAMSLAICGLVRPGVTVRAPEVVAKSYPSFWHDLDRLIR